MSFFYYAGCFKMSMLKKPNSEFNYLPHQVTGIEWMMMREAPDAEGCCGGILADDMGLGKTWQTIGLIKNNIVSKTLLVTPPVLTAQWVSALNSSDVSCAQLKKGVWSDSRANVCLITYDKIWRNLSYINQTTWDRVILDEGHYIRNGHKTRRFMGINSIPASRKWVLSGTPVQNGTKDFKNLASWLGCSVVRGGLTDLAKSIVLRRSITILADKMPVAPVHVRNNVDIECESERDMFHALIGRLENALENNFPSSCILELYLRVQMFISHPQIYIDAMKRKYGDSYMSKVWTKGSSKMAAFGKLLDGDSSAPTLVFCHFRKEMELVKEQAETRGYNTFFVRGGESESSRKFNIEKSKTLVAEGKPVLLICQIIAGNCGLNLQHLTRVIFYTQHWNPAVMDQAMTRSYRYGQTKNVSVYHLLYGAQEMLNIDRLMLGKHAEKRCAAMSIMAELEFAYHPDFDTDSK